MASRLITNSVAAPGFFGLNTQESPVSLSPEFATEAVNCIIDKFGRITSRKGYEKEFTNDATLGSANVSRVHQYVKKDATTKFIVIGNKNIFTLASGTLTSIYNDATWTDDNWQVVNFNNKCYFFQRGHDPLVYDGTTCQKISAHGSYAGTVQQANCVLAAFGRLWVADTSTDKTDVWWSDLLIGEAWSGGTAGQLSSDKQFTGGARPITALAQFNNFLVIFYDRAIFVYSGADTGDPALDLTLEDTIDNIGCIARDSVVNVGDDLLFLSDSGVHSLRRLLDAGSNPLLDVSKNVKDDLLIDIAESTDYDQIQAIYVADPGFYLLSVPYARKSYCFDLSRRLDDGSARATTWSLYPLCMATTQANELFFGFAGTVGKYEGYYDDDDTAFTMTYTTSWIIGSQEAPMNLKILKKARAVLYRSSGQRITWSWGFDYDLLSNSYTKTAGSYSVGEFNIGEFGSAEFGASAYIIDDAKVQLSGSGRVYQLSMDFPITGAALSIQQIDVFSKLGRLAHV